MSSSTSLTLLRIRFGLTVPDKLLERGYCCSVLRSPLELGDYSPSREGTRVQQDLVSIVNTNVLGLVRWYHIYILSKGDLYQCCGSGSSLFGSPGSGSGSGKIPDPDPLSTKRPFVILIFSIYKIV